MKHKYIIVRKNEKFTESFNGREFDRYTEPQYFDSIKDAAVIIERKKLIYVGMSSLIGIKKVAKEDK